MKIFERMYGCLRTHLPKTKGEVKGKTLSEDQVAEVVRSLLTIQALFEVVIVDLGMHSKEEILRHKSGQEEAITAHLTSKHSPKLVQQVWEFRRRLQSLPPQLYVQSVAMGRLVYHTLNHMIAYHAFRIPCELGEYHWRIDAKDRVEITPWERWWSTAILPMLEFYSTRKPFFVADEGDYRCLERFRKFPSTHKTQSGEDPSTSTSYDLKMVMTEDLRFSSDIEFGLEAVDILTNTIRRSLSGNFGRSGWMEIPRLMIHRSPHYIEAISLSREDRSSHAVPYSKVISDFRHRGRPLFPKWYLER